MSAISCWLNSPFNSYSSQRSRQKHSDRNSRGLVNAGIFLTAFFHILHRKGAGVRWKEPAIAASNQGWGHGALLWRVWFLHGIRETKLPRFVVLFFPLLLLLLQKVYQVRRGLGENKVSA